MKTEYLYDPCIYCDSTKVRHRLKGDWKRGAKISKGYSDKFDYLICDNCHRGSILWHTQKLITNTSG